MRYRSMNVTLVNEEEFVELDNKHEFDMIIDVRDDDKNKFYSNLNECDGYYFKILIRYFGNRFNQVTNWILEESCYIDGLKRK